MALPYETYIGESSFRGVGIVAAGVVAVGSLCPEFERRVGRHVLERALVMTRFVAQAASTTRAQEFSLSDRGEPSSFTTVSAESFGEPALYVEEF